MSAGFECMHGRNPHICTVRAVPAKLRGQAEWRSDISLKNHWLSAQIVQAHVVRIPLSPKTFHSSISSTFVETRQSNFQILFPKAPN